MEPGQGVYSFEIDYAVPLGTVLPPGPRPEFIRYVIAIGCSTDCAVNQVLPLLAAKPPVAGVDVHVEIALASAPAHEIGLT